MDDAMTITIAGIDFHYVAVLTREDGGTKHAVAWLDKRCWGRDAAGRSMGRSSSRPQRCADQSARRSACATPTALLPSTLPVPPSAWATPYWRLAAEVCIPADLASGHSEAAALLTPILAGTVLSATGDPDRRSWEI